MIFRKTLRVKRIVLSICERRNKIPAADRSALADRLAEQFQHLAAKRHWEKLTDALFAAIAEAEGIDERAA